MAKMLWELALPVEIAEMREDLSKNNIWKYLRYFKMFMTRFRIKINGKYDEDFNYDYFSKIMFGSYVGIINDPVYGATVGRLDIVTVDAKYKPKKVNFEFDNGTIRRNLTVGKDVVVAYADNTRIAPVLYIWAIANKILTKEAIIDQQDNMLRKPIIITGEGEDFDNAMNNANRVLSGIEWINTKKPTGKGSKKTLLDEHGMEVLNLQLGNAYKGTELWDSRKHYEELLCDYLGYTTTKNEKRERMNTLEVKSENSIGQTAYKDSVKCMDAMVEDVKRVLGIDISYDKMLDLEQEVSDNGSNENEVDRTTSRNE